MTPQEADRQIQHLLSTPFHQLTDYEQQNHSTLLVEAQKVVSGARGEGEHMTTAIGTFDWSGDGSNAVRMLQINDASLADAKERLEKANLVGDAVLAAHLEGAIKDVEARQGPDYQRIEKHLKDSEVAYLNSVVAQAKDINQTHDAWREKKMQHFVDLGWSKDDAAKMVDGPNRVPA